MVVQLGFATIISVEVRVSPFTSGTINFIASFMRQAELLSMTVTPDSTNLGAQTTLTLPPAEKIATSGFSLSAVVKLTISICFPQNSIRFPTDFSEATGISCAIGKDLVSREFSIVFPTKPVAPTIAMRRDFILQS